jgi:hypothetical protein
MTEIKYYFKQEDGCAYLATLAITTEKGFRPLLYKLTALLPIAYVDETKDLKNIAIYFECKNLIAKLRNMFVETYRKVESLIGEYTFDEEYAHLTESELGRINVQNIIAEEIMYEGVKVTHLIAVIDDTCKSFSAQLYQYLYSCDLLSMIVKSDNKLSRHNQFKRACHAITFLESMLDYRYRSASELCKISLPK